MKIGLTSKGGWEDTLNFLKLSRNNIPTDTLNKIGAKGSKQLAAGTPKDRGITAAGWKHKVETRRGGADVYWYNDANPTVSANVALLVQLGHGTRNGGYVPPVDYINPALSDIFASAGDLLVKEMIK